MFEAKHLVVFTGAGISTESGLPDFRGPDGIWTHQAKGLPPKARQFGPVGPNTGHMAIVELQKLGRLSFLISKLRCTRCEAEVDKSGGLSRCSCGGKLVSNVVNFGQPLPRKALADSYWHSEKCDLFIVAGSSLVVTPAADMPRVALESGGETPFDRVAHLRFWEGIGEVLPPAVARLKEFMRVS